MESAIFFCSGVGATRALLKTSSKEDLTDRVVSWDRSKDDWVGLFVAVLPEPLFSGIENKGVVLE